MSHVTTPVSYDEVVEAVDTLIEAGKPKEQITGRDIRTAVGDRGSFNTLLKHRDRYYAELDKPRPEQFVTDDDLVRVRTIVNEVVARQIAIDRERAQMELRETRAQTETLEAKNTDLEDVATEIERRLDEALGEADRTREHLADLQAQLIRTEAALEEARRANDTLANLLSLKVAEPVAHPAQGGGEKQKQAEDHKAKVDASAAYEQANDLGHRLDDDHDAFPLDPVKFTSELKEIAEDTA